MVRIANQWIDYELIDAGNKEKLDRFKDVVLRRPDTQALWPIQDEKHWQRAHGHYLRSSSGGGKWDFKKQLPESWIISYKDLKFKVSPTGFKHTGIFPEQAVNWDYMMEKIQKEEREIRVLNLFAYTGGATLACAYGGASEVVHVDAAKGMVAWAKENVELSNLTHKKIRFIVEDCLKFVEREKRRGRTYHAIIMDPPSYGRGPNGEVWKLEEELFGLIEKSLEILDENPLFFLVNTYTTGFPVPILENIMKLTIGKKHPNGHLICSEIGLPMTSNQLVLPCGISGLWEAYED